MKKSRRYTSIFIILILLVSLYAQPASARIEGAPPLPGKWVGQWQRTLNIVNCTSDPCVNGVATYTMPIQLRVDADNAIVEGVMGVDVAVVVDVAALGFSTTCEGHGEYTITGGNVSTGAGGLPVFDITGKASGSFPIYCNGAPMPDDGGTVTDFKLKLAATASQGSKVTGELAVFDPDKFDWSKAQLQSAGATVTSSEAWDLTNKSPFLNDLTPRYERYFLEGVSFENRYRATVDWNGNAPGYVNFAWSGQSTDVPASGEEVDLNLDMGTVSTGKSTLEATAYTAEGDPSISRETDIVIVPMPGWGNGANFSAGERAGSNVIYKGETNAPEQPLNLPYLEIPDIIPMINGKWGVAPVQFPVELLATSAGGQSAPAPIAETEIELYLGGDTPDFELKFEGDTVTNMQPGALTIYESQAKTTIPVFNKEVQVGLLDLVPQMSAVSNAPIVGDLTEAINGILALTGNVNVNVDGIIDIGPNNANSSLTLTSGSIRPSVQAYVQFMVNLFNMASAWVGGGGSGQFTLQVAPTPKWQGCNLAMEFAAGAKVVGLFDEQYTKSWPLTTCGGASQLQNGSKGIAAPQRAPTFDILERPETWQPEQSVLNIQTLNGVEQTTLVGGASSEAMPALAVGPDNRLAFTWVSEAPDLERPRSQEISLRLYDGQDWSDPIRLSDNATLDTAPTVAFDRAGRVMVAWVEHKQARLAEDTAFDEAFVQSLEIYFAVVDPERGKVLRRDALTQDDVMDFNPQLTRGQDGTLWLGWLNSPGTTMSGNEEHPNQVFAARWDGADWSATETALTGLVGTLTWRLAALDAESVLITADIDDDGTLSTAADREIIATERDNGGWATARKVTDNDTLDMAPLAAYTPEGEPLLAWANEEAVLGLSGDLEAEPQTWLALDDTTPLINGVLLAGADDERLLLWPDQTIAMDVRVSRYDPGANQWPAPEAFLSQSRQATSLTAGITSQGDLVVGLAALDTVTETITLPGGESFDIPGQAQTADLVVAGVQTSFAPQPPMVIEKVRLASSGGTGVLLWVGIGLLALVLAGGGYFWFKHRN